MADTQDQKPDEVTPPADPSGEEPKGEEPAAKSAEEIQKENHLANLDKAIQEGTDELARIRKEKREAAGGSAPKPGEEELPIIDDEDPGAKAWTKRIRESVAPMNDELEKGKEEVRSFALRAFLADKPALAKNAEKIKELVQYYDKIKTASERTTEGVLLDLRKAYAVVFSEDILEAAKRGDIERARVDGLASDIAVDRGATGYQNPKPPSQRPLSQEEMNILHRWGQTPEEWQKDAAQYST